MAVIKTLFLSIVSIFIVCLHTTQSLQAKSLRDALAHAYLNNPNLISARLKQKGLDEAVANAYSGWRPKIILEASASVSDTDTLTKVAENAPEISQSDTINPNSYTLSVIESLYSGGRTTSEIKVARANVNAGQADLLLLEQDTLLSAIRAYVDVLNFQVSLNLSKNNFAFVSKQFQAAKDKYSVGVVTQTEVAQAQARLYEAKANKVNAEGDLITAIADYKHIFRVLPINLQWPKPALGIPENKQNLLEIALRSNPEVIKSKYKEEAASEDVNVARSALLPIVTLEASYTRQNELSSLTVENNIASIGAKVNIPIYQSGSEYSLIRTKKLIAAERRLEIEMAKQNVLNEATKAWEALTTALSSKKAFEMQVQASKLVLEGLEKESMVGLRTTLDLLDAEQDLFDSRVELVRAKAEFISASYWVKAVEGSLTALDLNLPVKLYNPELNLQKVRSKWF